MRQLLILSAFIVVASCQPAAPPSAPATSDQSTTSTPTTTPVSAACNDLAPDPAHTVLLASLPPAAGRALASNLNGGPLTPGTYDLTSGVVQDGATRWTEARAVALSVADGNSGAVVNYAEAHNGEISRWSANFSDAPSATLTFTCGRSGQAAITYQASNNELRMSIPAENGVGRFYMVFAKRP